MHDQLVKYQTLPEWTNDSVPLPFQKKHNTKQGTWAKLTVLQGELEFCELDEDDNIQQTHVVSAQNPAPFVEPQAWHKVRPLSDDLRCYLEFYCLAENYFQKKYNLSAPHSEVLEVLKLIDSGDALDLGCGRGRNSVLMQTRGFNVTALDQSEKSIGVLEKICAAEESCSGLQAKVYDIQTAAIQDQYDLIISTVVFQFLQASTVNAVIRNIQQHTRSGGYNLIVAPASTPDFQCSIDFPFTFSGNELLEYYDGWTICKYNEDMGVFHRKDENGDFCKSRFAVIIAQK
jgi:tellurite methyltransferase